MVTRDRGQMMLLGAVALAMLILMLVPVYNAVFLADGAGGRDPGSSPVAIDSYRTTALEAAQRLAIRTGHSRVYSDNDSVTTAFATSFHNHTLLASEAAVSGTDTVVNTTFDPTAPGTTHGVRVVQNRSDRFDKPLPATPSGPANWFVVRTSGRTQLGWLTVRLDGSNVSDTQPFIVKVSNGSHTAELAIEGEDSSNDVSVQYSRTVGGSTTTQEPTTCETARGSRQLVLDLYRGQSASDDCTFTGLSSIEGPVDVWFENGDSAYGEYELVVRDDSGLQPTIEQCTAAASPSNPCSTPVLWQLSVTTELQGDRTTYTGTTNVSVYGGQ
jgi:hypothetical protein